SMPTKFVVNNAFASSALTCNVAGDFSNKGTVSSPGALSIVAGGTFTNAGTMQSQGNINLMAGSGNFFNSGTISASAGNVTFNTADAVNLNIDNHLGTIQALQGAINLRDASYAGKANESINGGNLFSEQFNLNSGSGTALVNVGQITGEVNVNA